MRANMLLLLLPLVGCNQWLAQHADVTPPECTTLAFEDSRLLVGERSTWARNGDGRTRVSVEPASSSSRMTGLIVDSAAERSHLVDPNNYREKRDCVAHLEFEDGETRELQYTIVRLFLPGKFGSGGTSSFAFGCMVATGRDSCEWASVYGQTPWTGYAYPRPE